MPFSFSLTSGLRGQTRPRRQNDKRETTTRQTKKGGGKGKGGDSVATRVASITRSSTIQLRGCSICQVSHNSLLSGLSPVRSAQTIAHLSGGTVDIATTIADNRVSVHSALPPPCEGPGPPGSRKWPHSTSKTRQKYTPKSGVH